MKHIAIVIDWYGPYSSLEEARAALNADYEDGLYMVIGKIPYQREDPTLQYIGISKKLRSRVGNNHHKLGAISKLSGIWLGEVASTGIPGKKKQATDLRLDLSEWCHSYFLQLPLNDKKTVNPPKEPVTVMNRWWFTDYETKRNRRPHPDWPDIIDYWGKEYGAKLSWLGRVSGGRCIVWRPDDF
ncbi:MAG: hypothetical protein D3908_05330 [Candidatus Electrothrix sp. AUS4]|nr:hypothetical protein [Candidatus Electrothrix sp. AUS4]